MKPLTIALCCNSSFGVANFRAGVIRALRAQGHRVVVIAPEDEYSHHFAQLGAEYVPWQLSGRGTGLLHELRAVRQLAAIYQDVRPDIAFHYTIKAVLYGALASKHAGSATISIITGLGYVFLNHSLASRIAKMLYRLTLRWSDEIWFLNADDREQFDREGLLHGGTVRLLPGEGVDMVHFDAAPDLPPGPPVFLLVARLLRDKGVHEFVEAAALVKRQCPSARFQLLGAADADNPNAVGHAQVQQWLAEGTVEYLGTATDVRPAILKAHCIVLPSYREGVPRSLLEAAAMRRPVVATDVPGCRDVVQDGVTGLLCEARNAPDLAAKMLRIAQSDRSQLLAMGDAGRAMVARQFDERIIIGAYLATLGRFASARVAAVDTVHRSAT